MEQDPLFDLYLSAAAILQDVSESKKLTHRKLVRDIGEVVEGLAEAVSRVSRLEYDLPEHADEEDILNLRLARPFSVAAACEVFPYAETPPRTVFSVTKVDAVS